MREKLAQYPDAVLLLILVGSSLILMPPWTRLGAAGNPGGQDRSGKPTNRLAGESSPYLLLHRHDPVDWYPWGPEALSRARAADKPIFLSVGYSTCYWCHVMERESFSDPEIAELMNRHFVNIKVDREERPDLDGIYLMATRIITRDAGGWPNSVFLTPDLCPFFAGTYFPPEDRWGRPGFPTVLRQVAEAWETRRGDVEAGAERISRLLHQILEERGQPTAETPPVSLADRAVTALRTDFDDRWGGFGAGPKFPSPAGLVLLLEMADDRSEAADMLGLTLSRMARGGIYDQLGGGFHRYATDEKWRLPHFEKMLYDNAQLLDLYARWHRRTGDPEAARVVGETAEFLDREMTSPDGAFFSAIDAETDGVEGAFYTWTKEELDAVLAPLERSLLGPILGFGGEPFFADPHGDPEEKRYVLYQPSPMADQAARLGASPEELLARIAPMRRRLLAHRSRRRRPSTDDKVLTDWNGMTIAGLAVAGRSLGEPRYVQRAERAADLVLTRMWPSYRSPGRGPLRHVRRLDRARIPAYLGDYVFLVRGLLELHESTGRQRWLDAAVRLTGEQIERLADPAGGFFDAAEQPDVLVRTRNLDDGAIPSANAVAVLNLIELGERTDGSDWRRRAGRALRAFSGPLHESPSRYATLTVAVRRFHRTAPTAARDLEHQALALVEAAARFTGSAAGGRPFVVELRIAEGWHVQANPASDELLIPTRLEAPGGELLGVRYPAGREAVLGFSESTIAIYDGRVEIRGRLLGSDLELTYQACDDRRCLPPVTRPLPVE